MSENQNLAKNVEVVSQEKSSVMHGASENFCHPLCKVCNSSHLKAIHNLKRAGHPLHKIVEIARDKLHFEVSTAGLSRHFSKYQKRKNLISAQLINDNLIEEATCQAVHTKKLVGLIDKSFKMIEEKIKEGLLYLTVSDLEKLMKLRYQVMNGEDTDENDIRAIFQKASNQYGLNLQQGVLFKN